MEELLTVGHGRLQRQDLGEVLTDAGVGLLVDVRRYPGSRHNPDVGSGVLAGWLEDIGIEYRWEERLGGRRSLKGLESPDVWWRVDAFRAYAAHTRTGDFQAALGAVLSEATSRPGVALMCSETVWWRCHRRLVADVAVLAHGAAVTHLGHDGSRTPHPPAPGARVRDDGLIVWDGSAGAPVGG